MNFLIIDMVRCLYGRMSWPAAPAIGGYEAPTLQKGAVSTGHVQ